MRIHCRMTDVIGTNDDLECFQRKQRDNLIACGIDGNTKGLLNHYKNVAEHYDQV